MSREIHIVGTPGYKHGILSSSYTIRIKSGQNLYLTFPGPPVLKDSGLMKSRVYIEVLNDWGTLFNRHLNEEKECANEECEKCCCVFFVLIKLTLKPIISINERKIIYFCLYKPILNLHGSHFNVIDPEELSWS